MRKEFLPFCLPSINKDDIANVVEVLQSGWITTGKKNAEFEKAFAKYVNLDGEAVALTSATAGMHLLLKLLNIGPGDEVITPSMTWVSTVNLIELSGATPVFADIDKDNLMVSRKTIEPLITDKTKLIIPVHFAGAALDMDPIRDMCAKENILLIEDAAHAVGTEYKGQKIGSFGTSIFSFHPIKNITTGEGGMICTFDQKLAEHIRQLKFHGLGVDAFDRFTQGRKPQAQVLEPGYKYNMTDIQAALGLSQLSRLDEFIEKRKELSNYYLSQLSEIDEVTALSVPEHTTKHAWHLFIVRLDIDKAGFSRNFFMEELQKKNIGTGIHFQAVHLQKYYKEKYKNKYKEKYDGLENTCWNSDRICSLPLFPQMASKDVDYVINSIKEIIKSGR